MNPLVRQHFSLVPSCMPDLMADAGDTAVSQTDMELTVFSVFCASPQEEEPQSLMCQSLTLEHLSSLGPRFGSNSKTLQVRGWEGQKKELVADYMIKNRRLPLQVQGGKKHKELLGVKPLFLLFLVYEQENYTTYLTKENCQHWWWIGILEII